MNPAPSQPELMSPAGYWPQLRAAIEAGADAVYFGLDHFSARAKVGFRVDELPEVMSALHERGVKGFVTFNTLVFDHELQRAEQAILRIADAGVDAIIVQDTGIAKLTRQLVPELDVHGSTQMSVTSAEAPGWPLPWDARESFWAENYRWQISRGLPQIPTSNWRFLFMEPCAFPIPDSASAAKPGVGVAPTGASVPRLAVYPTN